MPELDEPAKTKINRPRPKYQVFVSSTFVDLHNERREITWEILKAGQIPAGMENFSATDNRGWKVIQRTIDRSDYYVVLVAGMYGTVDAETGVSWTQREYAYAKAKGLPVLPFVRRDDHITQDKSEKDLTSARKLTAFKEELRNAHLCESWGTAEDLRARVAQALRQNIQDDEDDGTSRPGWYRGDEVAVSSGALEEFARLSAENAELKGKLDRLEAAHTESLELTMRNGAPAADLEGTFFQVEVVEGGDHQDRLFRSALSSIGEPSLGDVQAYADDVERTVWAPFKVFNAGSRPARHVVAEFVVTGGKVFIESIEKPSSLRHLENQWCYNAKEHVYVDYTGAGEPGEIRVLQRIKQIAVGGAEDLIQMGFRPFGSDCGPCAATVRYVIRSEDGISARGEFRVQTHHSGSKRIGRSQLLDD